jgi:hypothetical protein
VEHAVAKSNVRTRAASFVRVRAGRIVEVHVRPLADLSEVESLDAEVYAAVQRAGRGAVICADHRLASPLSREMADVWSRAMRGKNIRIARSGVLLDPTNTMYNLQVQRVVSCAGNPARRLFVDKEGLLDWVGEVLAEPERRALRDVFSEAEGD